MIKKLNDKDDVLASELAMGLLDGDEKRAARDRYETDVVFRHGVDDWQNKLSPMLDEVADIAPSSAVWDAVSKSTDQVLATEKSGLWSSLAFWRGLSFVTGGLATATIAGVLFFDVGNLINPPNNTQPLVAGLTATGKAPAFLARFDPASGGLVVQVALKDEKEIRVAELWLIPKDGVPRSLGLLSDKGTAVLKVNAKTRALFANGGTLAVSLEPQGGSTTGAPTGPVIASGKLQIL